jgi:hypothetical protein
MEIGMRALLIGLAVLTLFVGAASGAQPLSDAQLEEITAGAAGSPSFAANFVAWPGLPPSSLLSWTTSSQVSSTLDHEASAFGLGEAGLTGSARLGEYLGVVRFLGQP